jgi:hypothetical protein
MDRIGRVGAEVSILHILSIPVEAESCLVMKEPGGLGVRDADLRAFFGRIP